MCKADFQRAGCYSRASLGEGRAGRGRAWKHCQSVNLSGRTFWTSRLSGGVRRRTVPPHPRPSKRRLQAQQNQRCRKKQGQDRRSVSESRSTSVILELARSASRGQKTTSRAAGHVNVARRSSSIVTELPTNCEETREHLLLCTAALGNQGSCSLDGG